MANPEVGTDRPGRMGSVRYLHQLQRHVRETDGNMGGMESWVARHRGDLAVKLLSRRKVLTCGRGGETVVAESRTVGVLCRLCLDCIHFPLVDLSGR